MTASPPSVADLMDRGGLKPLQLITFALCTSMAVLDGLDSQSIGIVAPLMSRDLRLAPSALGAIFSLSQLGAAIGAMVIGPLGDRFGRKPVILVSGALITLFTFATAFASTFYPLLALRSLASLGLGAALPLVMALASDYSPNRLKGVVVTVVFAGYPLGGAIGGLVNGLILAHFSWRAVFYFGAAMPGLVSVLALAMMPESIQFLILRGRSDRAKPLLERIDPLADIASFASVQGAKRQPRVPLGQLFSAGLGWSTTMLWGVYFFTYATLKVMTTWFPSIMARAGFDASAGGYALGAFNLGATVGMAGAGYLTDRFGAFRALTPALIGGSACLLFLGSAPTHFPPLLVAATLVGVLVGIAGAGTHAVAVGLYPADIRSTGLGAGVAASRYGQVVSPMVVALMLTAGLGSGAVYSVVAGLPLIAVLFVFGLMLRTRAAGGPAQRTVT